MFKPDCLLIKTAPEISLKSHFVRKYFMLKLSKNIKSLLRAEGLSGNRMEKSGGRIILYSRQGKLKSIAGALRFVFGIHSIALARQLGTTEKDEIIGKVAKESENYLKKGNTFAVRASVAGQHAFNKMDLNREIGSAVLEKMPSLRVKLEKPEKEIFVEARERNTYLYFGEIPCHGGIPTGCEGSVAVLFEGRREELLAAWLMMKRGCNVFPLVEGKSKKIVKHINRLEKWNLGRKFKFTELGGLKGLADKKDTKVQALVKADIKLKDFRKEDEGPTLPVFRPLVFYPEDWIKGKIKIIEGKE